MSGVCVRSEQFQSLELAIAQENVRRDRDLRMYIILQGLRLRFAVCDSLCDIVLLNARRPSHPQLGSKFVVEAKVSSVLT